MEQQHKKEGRSEYGVYIKSLLTKKIALKITGLIKDDHVEFQVVYMCLVCNPIKDMEVECVVRNVTKAGIHAHVMDDDENVPIIVFIARDHNNTNPQFETIREADAIKARIIGTRFELNDTSITAIAGLA